MRTMTTLKALTVVALTAACLGVAPQTPASALVPIQVSAWTCETHSNIRMPKRGDCPICEAALSRTKIVLQTGSPGAAGVSAPYPLETCIVSGLKLGANGTPVVMMHEDREMRFCCAGCVRKFTADPKKHLETLDRKIIETQLAAYPLATCPVSGEPLDAMGTPVDRVYRNRLVRFCCNGCVRKFKKDPAPVLAALDAAVLETQRAEYPLETCIVSGQALDSMGGPLDYLAGNRLVRFCCAGCVSAFQGDPAKQLAIIDAAAKKKAGGKKAEETKGHDHDHDHGHDHGHGHDHDH